MYISVPPRKGKFVRSATVLVAAAAGIFAYTALSLAAEESIQGIWEGKYVCSQGPTGLTLTIEGDDPSRLTARFKFYPVPENPRVPHGELEMLGKFDARIDQFQFKPGRWIKRPSGFATVGLSGFLDSSGQLTGRLPVSGCQTFALSRALPSSIQEAAKPAAPSRDVPKSFAAARTLADKCEVILAWVGRIKSEYPDLDLYRTSSTVLDPKILNLYRDQFFAPVFGGPFEQTSEPWRRSFFHEVVRPCSSLREGQPTYRDRFNDYYTFFFRPFSLPRGWLSFEDMSGRLGGLRLVEEWRNRVLNAIDELEPTAANLREIDSYLEQGRKDLEALWPSEKAEFENKLVARKQEMAESLIAAKIKEAEGLDVSRASAGRLSESLAEIQTLGASLPDDRRRAASETLRSRLENMVSSLMGEDLQLLRSLPDGGKPEALAGWLDGFERKYKPYTALKTYSDAISVYRDKRNKAFESGLAVYQTSLEALPETREGLKAAAHMLQQAFTLAGDEGLPAYATYKSATLARIASIRQVLKEPDTAAQSDAARPAGEEAANMTGPSRPSPSSTPLHLCDELASHPQDTYKPSEVAGVPDDKVQSENAIEACIKATEEAPDEPRFAFQLARALVLAGMTAEAKDFFQSAADRDYGPAFAYLADYQQDEAKTRELYERAAQAGFAPAARFLKQSAREQDSDEFPTDRFQVPGLMLALYKGDFDSIPDDRDTRGVVVSIFKTLNEYCGEPPADVGFAAMAYGSEQAAKILGDPSGRAGAEVVANDIIEMMKQLESKGVGGLEDYVRDKAILRVEGLHDGKLLLEKFGCSDMQVQRVTVNLHNLVKARRNMKPDPSDANRLPALMSQEYRRLHGIPAPASEQGRGKELKLACLAGQAGDQVNNARREAFCRCIAAGAINSGLTDDDMTLLAADFSGESLNRLSRKHERFAQQKARCQS